MLWDVKRKRVVRISGCYLPMSIFCAGGARPHPRPSRPTIHGEIARGPATTDRADRALGLIRRRAFKPPPTTAILRSAPD